MTVALGSTLATVLLSKSTSLAEGIVALALLVFLQFANVAVGPVALVQRLVKSEPSLLVHWGQFLDGALDQQRVTRTEVLAALRSHDVIDAKDAAAVVLETDGSISVVRNTEPAPRLSTLPSRADAVGVSSGLERYLARQQPAHQNIAANKAHFGERAIAAAIGWRGALQRLAPWCSRLGLRLIGRHRKSYYRGSKDHGAN